MTAPMIRVPIWKAMVAVAITALALTAIKGLAWLATEWRYSTYSYGRNTSVFAVGDRVIPIVDVRTGEVSIPAGTPCLVVSDPPDDDSAYPYRTVKIRVDDRNQSGPIFGVKRMYLRAK